MLYVGVVWNDRLGSALVELLAQFVAVIIRVAKHLLRRLYSADQALGNRVVVGFTSVSRIAIKRPLASASAWIFVLRPPRERPTACFFSPLFRPLPSGAL